jgi:hypothetical protein
VTGGRDRAARSAERFLHALRGLPVGRLGEYGLDGRADLSCGGAGEAQPDSRTRIDHLLGHERLLVSDRRHYQREAVAKRLAHRVVA